MPTHDSPPDLARIVQLGASRPWRKWLLIIASAAAIVGGLLYFLYPNGNGVEEVEYITKPVTRGTISLIITASGNLAPTNQVVIGSELSGTAQEVFVDTNDLVEKGQSLAELDTSKLSQQTERSRATLLAAKARVSQTEATLKESEASFARQEELHRLSGGKTPSKATMETSLATVARAKADLESAEAAVVGSEAEVRSFERDLGKAVIRSPVDGIVLARSIEVGQTVAASFTAPTLFTIAEDLKKMELVVAVSEADIGRVEVGQTATFSVDAWPTRTYTAAVTKVSFGAAGNAAPGGNNAQAANTGVVSYSTELAVDNDDLSLRPGMTATVDIAIVNKEDILTVPNAALRFDPEVAAEIGKPDDTKRTLVQSLSPGGGRRWWRGQSTPKSNHTSKGPHAWILVDGKPAEAAVEPGITDGLDTELLGGDLAENQPVIVGVKPASKP